MAFPGTEVLEVAKRRQAEPGDRGLWWNDPATGIRWPVVAKTPAHFAVSASVP